MQTIALRSIITAITLIVTVAVTKAQQLDTARSKWNEETSEKWLKTGEWTNGTTAKPDKSVNVIEFATQYHLNKTLWDKVFAYLDQTKLEQLAPGKYPIDGDNAFAIVTEGPDKEFDQTAWESHRNYIDLHYVIKGKEKIGAAPVANATVTKAYDPAKDAANYTVEGTFYIATPGTFFLFFPSDAHRPGIKADDSPVKKLVIKIRYY